MSNLKKISTLAKGVLRSLSAKEEFGIRKGYIHRKNYTYLDKTESTEEWQKEVYEYAQTLMEKNHYKSVVDFGCGSGYKMIKYFGKYDAVGVEVEETHNFLVDKYPDHKWGKVENLDTDKMETDLVVCADVIEHVLNPDEFLNSLNKIDFKKLIISTPDRNTLRGGFDFGPPENPFHIREWTAREFRRYLSKFYNIELHQITNFRQATQMVVCTKK